MPPVVASPELADKVQAVIHAWRDGEPSDAAAVVEEMDGIAEYPSLVVDLAYEEYCLAETRGRAPNISTFCERFGGVRSKLRDVLEGHEILVSHPELLPLGDWPVIGETWNDLRIQAELGRGAFARVYLAHDPGINRKIVLKLSQRPTREGQNLGSLKHPHIVDVLWSRSLDGYAAVAMPYEGAVTLREAIETLFAGESRPTAGQDLLRAAAHSEPPQDLRPALLSAGDSYSNAIAMIFERLATALHHAQQHGVAHGDLKPANILISPGGHPFLIDFNLASDGHDGCWIVGGTLPYMAPERLRLMLNQKAANTTDWRADVYSFGVVLCEALTGRLPFGPDTARQPSAATELQLRTAGFISQTAELPANLRLIVADCLAADPRHRPTFTTLARRLASVHQRPRQRKQYLKAAAIALGVIAAVGLAYPLVAPAAVERPREPQTAADFLARGQLALANDNITAAVSDFNEAVKRERNVKTLGWLAYGLTLSNQSAAAIEPSFAIVDEFHCTETWVLNNLAAVVVKTKPRIEGNLRRAIDATTTILTADPTHRAARYNRALNRFWLERDPKTFRVPTRDCIADMELLLADGPRSGPFYLDAACLFAAGDDADRVRAVDLARIAIHKNRDANAIIKHPFLAIPLKNVPGFQALAAERPDPSQLDTRDLQLVTPE